MYKYNYKASGVARGGGATGAVHPGRHFLGGVKIKVILNK